MNATHCIKPGHGYWDTTRCPLGGDFHRVPKDGPALPVRPARDMPVRTSHGYLCEFHTQDGRKVWAGEDAFAPLD